MSSRAIGLEGPEYFLTRNVATIPFVIFAVTISAIALRICEVDRKASRIITELIVLMMVASYIGITLILLDVKSPTTITCVLALAAVTFLLHWRLGRLQLDVGRLVGAATMLIFCGLFTRAHASLYLSGYHFDPLTLRFIEQVGGHTVWKIVVLLAGCVSTMFIIDPPAKPRFSQLVLFVGAGVIAFILITTMSFGYIFSAYEVRNCPFAVYVVAVIPACAMYVAIRSLPSITTRLNWTFSIQSMSRAVAAPIVAFLMITWVSAQMTYLRVVSPARMTEMFHQLARIGGTSIVGTYATPVSIQTGSWSYFDPTFFVDGSVRDGNRFEVSRRDYRYLWFADGRTNADYLKPEYFVCWIHLNFDNVVGDQRQWRTCGDFGGIKEIRSNASPFRHVEVAKDDKRDLWSIVKLDWSGARPTNGPIVSNILLRKADD